MYDYGWRQYMPELGRWNGIDQLAEDYLSTSPYAYVANNPVSYADIDGRWFNQDGSINTSGYTPGFTSGKAMLSQFLGQRPGEGGGGGTKLSSSLMDKIVGLGGEWFNTGYGFDSNDYISLGYDGSYRSLNTKLDGYINIPEIILKGSSSGWGSQIQNNFNSYMYNRNGDNGVYGAIGKFTSYIANSIRSTNETFYSFLGGKNDPDPYTLDKLRGRDKIEANDMFEIIFMFYGRNTKLSGGSTGFQEALVQFGLDVEGIGNPVGVLSGSNPAKSADTADIWTTQGYGLNRNKDGTPYGVKLKNIRAFGLPVRKRDSMMKVSVDSTNYWNKQLRK
ncbi:hypothetical protein M2347_002313 [Chryseobacterium sp. H1D6B]|nr:hypothetical protein [Chryseobacterium sp. H1D6B]